MKTLDLTQEEAVQLIEDDKRIDKGEKLFELSKSENEVARKMKMSDLHRQPFVLYDNYIDVILCVNICVGCILLNEFATSTNVFTHKH